MIIKLKLILISLTLLFLIGCNKEIIPKEDISLKTEDNINIKATVWTVDGDEAVILIHMLDKDRTDWRYFAKKLNDLRITAIGIDLRGHGDSDGNWKDFNEEQFNKMILDVKAAKDILKKRDKKSISIIGASIGANVALQYAASDKEIKNVVLLSPGIQYRNINIESDIEKYKNNLLIVASEEDKYPFESTNIIFEKSNANKEIFKGNNLGHGTDMLKSVELENKIFEFLRR